MSIDSTVHTVGDGVTIERATSPAGDKTVTREQLAAHGTHLLRLAES
jgi:hypothetical protein